MLGGTSVLLAGPCLNASRHDIKCKFDGVIVDGVVLSRSRAMCVTPPLFTAGFIDVGMSLDDGMTYPYLGGITVTHDILSLVHVSDWNSTPGSIMNVTWAPEALRGVDTVSIAVFEYSEDIETGNVSWHGIRTIATGVPNNATPYEFSLDPSSVRKSAIVGAVGIVENSTSPFPRLLRRSIWSKIHPLNWLSPVNQDLWCQEWASEQQAAPFFLEGRPPCPCAERQARRDTGAFTTSLDCRGQHANSAMCTMQRHTTFCVTTNTPSSQGAGQECCYDYGGNLVDIDSVGVGISIRSHIRGVFPFWSTGRVPFLSHYIADVMPFLQCCGSSDEVLSGHRDPCRLFHSVRPAQTCYDYVAPNKIASAFGDPHYKTFDGLNYTFNGFGEFTLVNGSHGEFVLQARSVPVKGSQRGTIFTAMAMTARDSDVIHVEVNPRRSLDVYFRRAGRKFEMLDFQVLNEWRLKGVTVRASDDLSTEGLLVVFDSSGISLEFSAFEGSLAVIVKLPAHFRGTTQGLLGTSNDDTSDDLQTPNGTTLPLSSSLEKIFSEFGQTWEVLPGMSLFFYRTGFNQSAFTSQSYQPAFTVNDVQLEDNNASSLCGQDAMCRFDLQATGSELFARHTLALVGRFKHIQEDLAPVTCGELTSNPANGQVIVRGNSSGDVAYFTCDECFELRGSQAIRCHASGRWSALPPSCEPIGDRCPEPHVPANGNITLVRTCLETQVVFSCYEGFRLMGSSTISCLANGQWSAPCPKCHLDKPSLDQVVKQAERQLTAIESASIAAGVGVLLLALALAAACVVTRNRHVKEKEERKKRKSGVWTTIQNPTYNAKDKWSC
ncbi:sushi domain-containing protein 2-like [Diadema setosum]|uniref:sushi domain-containing protein 2-like n=1 Tax=Diadema setosum TaxID=31175 RepID=UPI003B3A664B